MRWLILALGGVFLVTLFWPRSPGIDPYLALKEALEDPAAHAQQLWGLSLREDGAGWVARLELARLVRDQEPHQALVLLQEALNLRESAEARLELAKTLEALERRDEALAQWAKLLPSSEAASAVQRLSSDPIHAASILVAGRAYSQALEVLTRETGARANYLRAQALVGLGRSGEAILEFQKYLAAFPNDAAALLEYGQALERAGETQKAVTAYRQAGSRGLLRLGLLLESLGQKEEALRAYQAADDPEAQFRAARLLEERGETSQALAIYQKLAQKGARASDDAALRSYLILVREGRSPEAQAMQNLLPPAFLWLLGEDPGRPAVPPGPKPVRPAVLDLAEVLPRRFPKEGALWAQIELEIALKKASPEEAIAIGEWYIAKGDYRAAYALGEKLLSSAPSHSAYKLAYPLAYWDVVQRWSKAYDLDPLLILAVIREESGFSPTAVSSSGARGLMQLLPSTARWIAEEKLGIPYREEDLFDPEYNIRLGSWYLHHLLDQFGEREAWAVAAYNGGPGNLQRWTAGAAPTPADLPAFLRSIETREYLTKVLNSWLTYRWLYPDGLK